MKKSEIVSTVVGVFLFALAAVFSISLLLVLFGGGASNPASGTFLFRVGTLLANVYGVCSVLIPLFLVAAGIQCFTKRWSIKYGVLLFGSIFPFFTLDALEHVCRMIASSNAGAVLGIKLTTALLIGAVIVAVEYALLAMLGDILKNMFAAKYAGLYDGAETADETDEYEGDDDFSAESEAAYTVRAYADEDAADEDRAELKAERADETDVAEHEAFGADDSDDTADIADDDEHTENASPMIDEAEEALDEPETPATLENGEDNPFAHVFDEEPADAEEVSDGAEEEFEPPVVRDTPRYNEAAFFPEQEDDATELEELDTFNPADSYVGVEEPVQEEPEEVEIFDEDDTDLDDTDIADEYDADDALSDDTADDEIDLDDVDDEPDDEDVFAAQSLADALEAEAEDEPFEERVSDDEPVDYFVDDDAEEPVADEGEAETVFDETVLDDISDPTDDDDDQAAPARAVPPRSGLDAIFAEMDDDAANDPVFDDEDEISVPVPAEDAAESEIRQESENVDPLAPPVVNAQGEVIVAAEQAVPIDFEDVDLDAMESAEDEVSVVQSDKDDFDRDGEGVVRLQKPAPLVEEPKPEPQRKIRGPYKIPTEGILDTYPNGEYWLIDDETKRAASDLKDTLAEFKIEAEVTGIRKGPVVTMFEILPAPGVKLSKIVALQDNIALRLAASSVRIVAPIPGKHAVGIEVPNKERAVVSFKEIVDLDLPQFSKMAIPVILGKDISGEPQVLDLAKTPHMLIAGSTGAGKSVCVNSMILSILYKRSPQDVKLIMIDPKVVELKLYNDIPHLLTPVITESKRAFQSLQYCLCEMERRYACLDGMGVRDIASYNKRIVERNIATEKLPYIVVIIDEFADLMATTGKELESTIARLAAMSRAVGIHLVLATQRPSIDVITGLIKANIPTRIAFMVASKMDSRIIIDQVGAEKLLGKGDMLYASATDPFPIRIQGTLVNDNEVERVVDYVKQYGEPEYIDDEIFVDEDDEGGSGPGLFSDGEDPLYDEALQIVVQAGKASASYIQRRLKIGYNRAARLVEEMEERGIVGPANGSKPREVIHVPS